jgi:hypothetical protein
MKAVARRKLTVLDAMVLVAAAAAGIAGARAFFLGSWDSRSISMLKMLILQERLLVSHMSENQGLFGTMGSSGPFSIAATSQRIAIHERRIALEKLISSFNVFLSVWTLALVLLGLRKPRPRLRRLVFEAGWSVCLTAIVVLVVRTLSAIVTWGADFSRTAGFPWPSCVAVFDDLEDYVRPAIVAVWLVIAMSGRGRLEWSSIGWLTMLTSTIWVLLILGGVAIRFLAPL